MTAEFSVCAVGVLGSTVSKLSVTRELMEDVVAELVSGGVVRLGYAQLLSGDDVVSVVELGNAEVIPAYAVGEGGVRSDLLLLSGECSGSGVADGIRFCVDSECGRVYASGVFGRSVDVNGVKVAVLLRFKVVAEQGSDDVLSATLLNDVLKKIGGLVDDAHVTEAYVLRSGEWVSTEFDGVADGDTAVFFIDVSGDEVGGVKLVGAGGGELVVSGARTLNSDGVVVTVGVREW